MRDNLPRRIEDTVQTKFSGHVLSAVLIAIGQMLPGYAAWPVDPGVANIRELMHEVDAESAHGDPATAEFLKKLLAIGAVVRDKDTRAIVVKRASAIFPRLDEKAQHKAMDNMFLVALRVATPSASDEEFAFIRTTVNSIRTHKWFDVPRLGNGLRTMHLNTKEDELQLRYLLAHTALDVDGPTPGPLIPVTQDHLTLADDCLNLKKYAEAEREYKLAAFTSPTRNATLESGVVSRLIQLHLLQKQPAKVRALLSSQEARQLFSNPIDVLPCSDAIRYLNQAKCFDLARVIASYMVPELPWTAPDPMRRPQVVSEDEPAAPTHFEGPPVSYFVRLWVYQVPLNEELALYETAITCGTNSGKQKTTEFSALCALASSASVRQGNFEQAEQYWNRAASLNWGSKDAFYIRSIEAVQKQVFAAKQLALAARMNKRLNQIYDAHPELNTSQRK